MASPYEDTPDGILEAMLECYFDTDTQHRSEVALCGDSWPGALCDLAEHRASIVKFAAEHGLRNPFGPPPTAEELVAAGVDPFDDIDF